VTKVQDCPKGWATKAKVLGPKKYKKIIKIKRSLISHNVIILQQEKGLEIKTAASEKEKKQCHEKIFEILH
jgi:hypothetical protein